MTPESSNVNAVLPTQRLQFIDGLRGIAVAMVVCFHAVVWGGFPVESARSFYLFDGEVPIELGRLRHIWSLGGAGVNLFLAISGFCLFWPLVKEGNVLARPMQIGSYIQRRIKRICPPYYFAFAAVILCSYFTYRFQGTSWWPWYPNSFQNAFPWQGWDSWFNVATHLLLIHGFFNAHINAFEGAYWSLSLEWQFYFLFIPLAFVARRFGVLWAALIPIVTTALFRVLCLAFVPQFLTTSVGHLFSLSRWVEFGAGMLAAAIVSGSIPQNLVQKVAPWGKLKLLYAIASLVIALTLEYRQNSPNLLPFAWGNASLMLLVLGAQWSVTRRFLEWRPLAWLGTISYSLYLTHGMVYMAMATLLTRTSISTDIRFLIYLLVGPLIAVAFAALFFLCFEKPFLTRDQFNPRKKKEKELRTEEVVQDKAAV